MQQKLMENCGKDNSSYSSWTYLIEQWHDRILFILDCPGRANESTPVPEEQYASRPLAAIRQYEDTDNWFADVSWGPLNGT